MSNDKQLNPSKSTEIVFIYPKCQTPTTLPGIVRETSVKILGINITNGLSASEHVHGVYAFCGHTACVTQRCRPYYGHSISPSYLTRQVPSVVLSKWLTDSELTLSTSTASNSATAQ